MERNEDRERYGDDGFLIDDRQYPNIIRIERTSIFDHDWTVLFITLAMVGLLLLGWFLGSFC